MDQLWDRLERALATHAPKLLASLQPGASERELRTLEAALGLSLPADLCASLRRHNGQRLKPDVALIDGFFLGDVQMIADDWQDWLDRMSDPTFGLPTKPARGVRKAWWHRGWIPFTFDGHANSYCVDLQPAAGGTVGQVLILWHDDDTRPLLARSYRAWLEGLLTGLEQGWVVPDGHGGLQHSPATPGYTGAR